MLVPHHLGYFEDDFGYSGSLEFPQESWDQFVSALFLPGSLLFVKDINLH
jgi:hypothetical protein